MDRRKFINLGGVGISSFTLAGFIPKNLVKKPIVIATWDAGIAANAGAWTILGAGGKAIDAVEKLSPDAIADENLKGLFMELSVEPIRADGKPTQIYVASIVARLREVAISRSIADLKSSLQRLNPVENEIEYNAAFAQLVALESARRSLHDLALGSL